MLHANFYKSKRYFANNIYHKVNDFYKSTCLQVSRKSYLVYFAHTQRQNEHLSTSGKQYTNMIPFEKD